MQNNYKNFATKFVSAFLLLIAISFSNLDKAKAQSIANYSFSTSTTGSLDDLSTGATNTSITSNTDDGSTLVYSLGMNFTFMGVTYSHFSANSNGQMELHTSSSATAIGTNVSPGANANRAIIAPMAGDNEVNLIRYRTTGSAPNRKFVLEWNQFYVHYTNNLTNAGNMQLWLDEATGKIDFVYGEIYNANAAATTSARSIGLSSSNTSTTSASITVSASPSVTNGTTLVSNTFAAGSGTTTGSPLIANLGSNAQGSRRVYTFTPPAPPVNAPTSLSFSAVTGTSMTLNWTDNSTNEFGFQIFRSTDNTNFTLATTTAANTTSANITGLTFGTNYFWRVVAVSEAAISTDLTGSQATTAGTLSGTVTVGNSATYQNLTQLFTAINNNGLSGNLTVQLVTGYPAALETYPIVVSPANTVGAFTVNIYPTVSGLAITSANATGTLNFNGSSNVTFDGRVNATGSTKSLEISSTATTAYAVQFINGASNNTIAYCNIRSTETSTTLGTITFAGSTGTVGNSNNTIDNNDIYDGATTPLNGIYSAGQSATVLNSNNSITNNNIYNFFGATSVFAGVNVASNSAAWNISSNRFYQTATRTQTTGTINRAILVAGSGNGYTINNNNIGSANSSGTGIMTITGSTNRFIGIDLNAGSTIASNIQGNTVANISITSTSAGAAAAPVFGGIVVQAGSVNVGTTSANTIGASTGNGSIVATSSITAAIITGIYATSVTPNVVNIFNNNIGGINATNSTAANTVIFSGIQTAGSAFFTIRKNNIGSASTARSILVGTLGTSTGAMTLTGITSANSTNGVTIDSNNIYRLVNVATSSSADLSGIRFTGSTASTVNIKFNNINNDSAYAGTMYGIFDNNTASSSSMLINIDSNNITDFSARGAAAMTMYGIRGVISTLNYRGNSIRRFNIPSSANVTMAIHGLFNLASPTNETVSNNIVDSLYISGTTTTASTINGINFNTTSGTRSISRNSISRLYYIGTGSTATINGILSASSTPSITRNKIFDLSATGATSLVSGISISSGNTNVNVANNLIGDLKAPAGSNGTTDVVRGINITTTTTTSNINLTHNTILLNAAGGANFSTSGVFHTRSATATTATLVLRNNIIINRSTQSGTGFVTAIRRTGDTANYSELSNNNLLYAGTPSANKLIYYNNTTGDQTIAAFKTRMAGTNASSREQNSFTAEGTLWIEGGSNPYEVGGAAPSFFQNTTNGNLETYLHINSGTTTAVEGGGIATSLTGVTNDYDGETRSVSLPDIGADEFVGVTPAPSINVTTTPVATCAPTSHNVVATILPVTGTLNTPVLTYNIGQGNVNINMTNTSGDIWEATIPPATNPQSFLVTWSISATNSANYTTNFSGTSYRDSAMALITNISASGSPATICAGASVSLTGTAVGQSKIGSGVVSEFTGSIYRFGTATGDFRYQLLYSATELTAMGVISGTPITSIAFTATTAPSGTANNFTISMANVSATALTSAYLTNSLTQVWTAATHSPVLGNNVYTLGTGAGSSSFTWDGTSSILVNICFNNPSFGTSGNVEASSTASVSNIQSLGITNACSTASGTTVTNRPNMTVTYNAFAPYTLAWLNSSNATLATSATTSVSPTSSETYRFRITSNATGCTRDYPVNITVNPNPADVETDAMLFTQCGTAVFNVYSASTPNPQFKFYTASTGGVLLATVNGVTGGLGSSSSNPASFTWTTANTPALVPGGNNSLWVTVTNSATGCEGQRVQIEVFVDNPQELTATANATATCVNRIQSLSVSSTLANYDKYSWHPRTNLFTDAAATIPYTITDSTNGTLTTVYYRRSSAIASDIITLSATNSTNGCSNATTVTMNVQANPSVNLVSANPSTVCSGTNVNLNAVVASTDTSSLGNGGTTSTGVGGTFLPGAWGGAKTQYIIRASELSARNIVAGNISSLSFTATSSGQEYQGFTLMVGQTTDSVLGTSNFIDVNGLTQVYLGTAGANNGFTPTVGVNTLNFGTGAGSASTFNWNGTSNIVLSFSWSRVPAAATATVSGMLVDNVGFNSTNYRQRDNITPDSMRRETSPSATAQTRPRFTLRGLISQGAGTGINWSWTGSGTNGVTSTFPTAGTNSNVGTAVPSTTTTGTYTYTVTATTNNANGCSTSVAANPITVKALPSVSDNGTVANQCGVPTYKVTSAVGGGAIYTFYANGSNTVLQTGTLDTFNYSTYTPGANNTIDVTVTETGANACTSPRTSITVFASAPNALTLSQSGTVQTCVNRIETIQVTSAISGTYVFTPTTNLFTNAAATTPYTPGSNATTVYFRRSSAATSQTITLTNTDGACNSATSVTFDVSNNPNVVNVSAAPTTVCSGTNVNLNAAVASNDTSTLGNGGTTSTGVGGTFLPGGWGGAKTQYIVRASELAARNIVAGNISALSYTTTSSGQEYQGFTLMIGQTTDSVLTASSFVPVSNLTQVFRGTVGANNGYTPSVGVNTLNFGTGDGSSSSFNWNGTSNIVLSFSWSRVPAAATATVSGMLVDNVGFNSTNYRQRDNITPDSMRRETIPTSVFQTRPRFTFRGVVSQGAGSNLVWTWNSSSASGITSTYPTPSATANAGIGVPSASTSGSLTYNVTASTNNAAACSTTVNANAILVNALPSAPTSTTLTNQCGLPSYSVSVVSGITYRWYSAASGGTLLGTGTTFTPSSYTGGAVNTVWVSGTNANGCESDRTQIDVNVTTPPTITPVQSSVTVCGGNTVQLSVNGATASNFDSIAWTPTTRLFTDLAGTIPYTAGTNTSSVYYKRNDSIALDSVYAIGVKFGTPDCYSNALVTVTVNLKPNIITATATPTSICSGAAVNLNANSANGGPGVAVVGNGTNTAAGNFGTPLRMGNSVGNQFRTQYLVLASDLAAANLIAGNITGLTINLSGSGGGTVSNLSIKLAHTNLSAFANTTYITTGFTTVLNMATYPVTGTVPTGDNSFTFNTPFAWDGVSNIIVEMCSQLATSGLDGNLNARAVGYAATIGNSASTTNCTSSTGNLTYNTVPNFRFNGIIGTSTTNLYNWDWNNGTTSVATSAASTINPTVTNTAQAITYTATATVPSTGCTASLAATPVTINPIPAIITTNTGTNVCGTPTFTATSNVDSVTFSWYTSGGSPIAIYSDLSGSFIYTGYSSSPSGVLNTLYVSASKNGCETPVRAQVDITSTSPPALVSNKPTNFSTCVDRIDTLTVFGSGYTNFTWTPTTNLFEDAACTIAYTGGNAGTVYFKRSSVTTSPISYLASANGGGCTNTFSLNVTVNGNPNITSVVASPSAVCVGSTVNLTARSLPLTTGSTLIGSQSTTEFTGSPYRAGGGTGQFRVQYLLTASELNSSGLYAGNITGLAFDVTSGTSANYVNYQISLIPTTLTALTSSYVSGGTLVHNSATYTTVVGQNVHNFSTPFNWNGTSNLIVNICYTVNTAGSSSTVNASVPGFTANNYLVATTGACTATSGTTTANRPMMRFFGQVGTDLTNDFTWTWNANNVNVATGSTATATATNGITSYGVTALNAATTCTSTSTSNTIVINPLPTAPVSTTAANQCGLPTFSVANVSGMTYKWYTVPTGGTPIVGANSEIYVYNGYTTGTTNTLYVTATNSNGCESERTQIDVNVATAPAITFSTGSTAATCQNRVQTISISSTLGDYSSYLFSPTTNLYVDANATIPYTGASNATTVYYRNPSINSSDIISVTGTNSSAPFCVNTATITVNVQPNPVVDTLKITPNTATICSGTNVTLQGIVNSSVNDTARIGSNGTTLSTAALTPFSGNWGTQRTQYIIRASDLTARNFVAGNFTGLSFTVTSKLSTAPYNGYTIKLANTTTSAFPTTGAAYLTPTFTTVYTGDVTTAVGTNNFVFGTGGTSSSFAWDGTSNVLVEVCFSNPAFSDNDAVTATATSPSYNAVYGQRRDGATLCDASGATVATGSTLPDILFTGPKYFNGAGSFTWSWTNSIGSTIANGETTSNVPTTTNGSSLTYSALVTNVATTCSTSATSSVITLNAAGVTPTISISSSSGSTSCSGNATTFTATAYSGSLNPTYTWRRNSTVVGTNSTTYIAPAGSLVNGDVITCELNTNNSCSTPSVITSNAITMTVNPSPAGGTITSNHIVNPGTNVVGSTLVVCRLGTTVNLYPSVVGGTNTYSWTSSNTNVGSITVVNGGGAAVNLNASGTTTVRYSITGAGSSSSCVTENVINFVVAPQVKPSTITGANSVCIGNTISLTNATPGGVWSADNSATINSSGALTGVNANANCRVFYTITNASGCSNRDTFLVNVRALPAVPVFFYAPGSVNPQSGAPAGSWCRSRTFTLIGSPAGGVWSASNPTVASVTAGGVVTTLSNGLGSVTYSVTNLNGCSNSRTMTGNVVTCASRNNASASLSENDNISSTLYPNPAKNIVNIRMDMLVGNAEMIITDVLGKKVRTQILSLGNNEVDINGLAKGLYLVNIVTTKGSQTQKLVVE